MKNGVAYENQTVYLIISIYLIQASTLPFKSVLPFYWNQSIDLWRNQWDGFYTLATLDWNKLILTNSFSICFFHLSWRNPSLPSPSVHPNQEYFPQKHETKNANWKFSKKYSQIILCYFEY